MTRQEAIKRLDELPSNLIEKAYSLDVVLGKLQLQYDSFLKDLYKAERIVYELANPGFIYFQIGPWKIIMETEED